VVSFNRSLLKGKTPRFATDFDNPSHVRGPLNVGSAPYWPWELTELLPCRTTIFIAPYLNDKDTEMETDRDMETEINIQRKRKLTIHGHGHRCGAVQNIQSGAIFAIDLSGLPLTCHGAISNTCSASS
jgi:hypothetical protein